MKTRNVAVVTVLGALAIVAGFLPFSFPFPIIPYLRYDLAEIPVFVALLAAGPAVAFSTATAYFLVLLAVGEFTPIGPIMKYCAVLSTLAGVWLGSKLLKGRGVRAFLVTSGVLGAILRVVVMTVMNYVVIVILFPEFLSFAASTVQTTTGLYSNDLVGQLLLVLTFTAVFNASHVVLTLLPSSIVAEAVTRRLSFYSDYGSWMRVIAGVPLKAPRT